MIAILLAGGLGTRLHSVTKDLYPKCLAPVNDKPFVHYLIDLLYSQGITNYVVAVSHLSDQVIESLGKYYPHLNMTFSIEVEPLGTGGAIKQALSYCKGQDAIVFNADSFVEFSIKDFLQSRQTTADVNIVCVSVPDISRFGAADIEDNGTLRKFFEKGRTGPGFINAGVYHFEYEKGTQLMAHFPGKFSFEHDILSSQNTAVSCFKTEGLFFDIGTPSDFIKAHSLIELNKNLFSV